MLQQGCLLVLVVVGIVSGAAPDLKNKFVYHAGFIGAGNDVQTYQMMTPQAALQACDHLPRCRAITYHGTNDTTTVQKVYFKDVSGTAGDASWTTFIKYADVTAPAITLNVGGNSEMALSLRQDSYTVQALNHTKANVPYTFVRPLDAGSTLPLCAHLGDVNIRLRAQGSTDAWRTFDSTALGKAEPVPDQPDKVLAAHDVTAILAGSAPSDQFPLRVVRSYETTADGKGLLMRFSLTNTANHSVEVGALGFAMPDAPGHPPKGIQTTVWNDPHVGGDHGFVEFVRVVDDEKTLLITPESATTRFEAWRPMLEELGDGSAWEWTVHSLAWAEEWANSTQAPFLNMPASTHGTPDMFPNAATPWPSTHGHEGVPVLSEASWPWNKPTSSVFEPGQVREYALNIQLAQAGPRSRNDLLQELGEPVMHGVPGYVLDSSSNAQLFVRPPEGSTVIGATGEASGTGNASLKSSGITVLGSGFTRIDLSSAGVGRARLSVQYSDNTSSTAHYYILPPFEQQVNKLGQFYSNDAWLPRDYQDPFGRSASVMPYDRETKSRVLNDARAYDVGLSDDAGGGNPLGFASKVRAGPRQDEVTHLDDYVKWTLYGIKPDTAKPPFRSLQVGGDPNYQCSGAQCDGIRMTMFYYSANLSNSSSGNFAWNYTEQDKCALAFGGPTWCMTENMANATYRAFNAPHHTASYWALYSVARNYDKMHTYQPWQWYLWRAVRTSIRYTGGGGGPGLMDGTVFREVLEALKAEVAANSTLTLGPQMENATEMLAVLTSGNQRRQESWASQPYPYGSEFGFDTTGQEEVVVWNLYFGNFTAAKHTVDHILSYMRSSPTWAYNGGARSWGDAGNNAKWLGAYGTGFDDRGQMHYRSGLNMIPLIEWYRANPDDNFLLEVSMGAITGQLTNIEPDQGAPSMMWWALPHMMTHDPHSGDYGLGFFGHALESGSYFVIDKELGQVCYLCDLQQVATDDRVLITPKDSFRRNVFLEPLSLYLVVEAGRIASLELDLVAKVLVVHFDFQASEDALFTSFRLKIQKTSAARTGSNFRVTDGSLVRGAYEVKALLGAKAQVTWE